MNSNEDESQLRLGPALDLLVDGHEGSMYNVDDQSQVHQLNPMHDINRGTTMELDRVSLPSPQGVQVPNVEMAKEEGRSKS